MSANDMAIGAALDAWHLTEDPTRRGQLEGMRAAIAAYEAALWQPIESAPRDGTVILAVEDGSIPVAINWREYDSEGKKETGEDGYWAFCDDLLNDVAPEGPDSTTWRPLPAMTIKP